MSDIAGTVKRENAVGRLSAQEAAECAAYAEDEVGGSPRTVLRLPEHLAPYRFCVSPLLKNKPELVAKARAVSRHVQ